MESEYALQKHRAMCREYNKKNRERLSAYRKNKYHTDEDFRKRCIEASIRWRNKKKEGMK